MNGSNNIFGTSFFKDRNVDNHLSNLHDKYVSVPANKAQKNIVFVCKSHNINNSIQDLGIDNSLENLTYTPMALTEEENTG